MVAAVHMEGTGTLELRPAQSAVSQLPRAGVHSHRVQGSAPDTQPMGKDTAVTPANMA